MSFKENLKAELAYNGISVKELALKSGIKKRAIDNYLRTRGAAIPSADTAVKIALALGVSVEFLINGDKPELPVDVMHISKELLRLNPKDRAIIASLVDAMIKSAS